MKRGGEGETALFPVPFLKNEKARKNHPVVAQNRHGAWGSGDSRRVELSNTATIPDRVENQKKRGVNVSPLDRYR